MKVISPLLKLQPVLNERTVKDEKTLKLLSPYPPQGERFISIAIIGEEVLWQCFNDNLLLCLSSIV